MMGKIIKLFKDERGNGVILFGLGITLVLALFLAGGGDLAKLVLAKQKLNNVADISADAAAKILDSNNLANNGVPKANGTKALNEAKKNVNANLKNNVNAQVTNVQISFNASILEVKITSRITLNGLFGSSNLVGVGHSKIKPFK